MGKKKVKDLFARRVAILSTIIAIAAVIVPYVQQKQQLNQELREQIVVDLAPFNDAPMRLTKGNFGEMGRLIEIPWHLTVSNTGQRKVSILKHTISVGQEESEIRYTGVSAGLYDNSLNQSRFPLILDAGESQTLYIYIGELVPKSVYTLLEEVAENDVISDALAKRVLGRAGVDMYGNKVKYQEFESGEIAVSYSEAQLAPRYFLTLETSRSRSFVSSASRYSYWVEAAK